MRKRVANLILSVTAGACLVSCQSLRIGRSAEPDPFGDLPKAFVDTPTSVPMPDRWWEAFASPELNSLMDRAFADNLELAKAWAQLRQARAAARSTAADGHVQLTGGGEASRTDSHGDGNGATRSYSTGLAISYEVDLWGRLAATTDAARLEADATEQDVRATALTLANEIANAWLAVKSYQAQIALVEDQLRTANEYLSMLDLRQRKGMTELVAVLQQRQDVAGLESTAESLRESLAVARLQLAYLLGLPDDRSLSLDSVGLPKLPPMPSSGVPSQLLSRRPDISAARLRVQAQQNTVAAARAARLPSLSLTGSATFTSDSLNNLFDSWLSNLAASLSAPLLDGGRLAAREEEAKALLDQRLLAYRDTALGAFLEVNEGLVRERWKQSYLARLRTEAGYAKETLAETQRRYLKGKDDYLAVLTALTAHQALERTLVAAEAQLLANRMDLCAALGGTWMSALQETK
jgi:NodT family efflux transporter outer membrane factor (OMF) lipoprotein